MNPIVVGFIAFACIFSGALLGLFIQGFLPEHHLRPESKDTVKLGAGLIATMAALVLGLLVSSAKSSFDAVNTGITQAGAKIIVLDRLLAHYGPEAQGTRAELRRSTAKAVDLLWPKNPTGDDQMKSAEDSDGIEMIGKSIRDLTPTNDSQRVIHTMATQLCSELLQGRWTLIEEEQNSLPVPLLVVLIFWITMLNVTYGLFAPRNATVIAVLFICALSVSGSIFLVIELSRPLDGTIKASSAPLVKALDQLGR